MCIYNEKYSTKKQLYQDVTPNKQGSISIKESKATGADVHTGLKTRDKGKGEQ